MHMKQRILPPLLFLLLGLQSSLANLSYYSPLTFVKPGLFRQLRGGARRKSGSSSNSAKSAVSTSPTPTPISAPTTSSSFPAPSINYNASSVDAGSLPTAALLESLETNVATGLSDDQVQARLKQYGPNALKPPQKASIWELIAEQFEDRLVQILLVVAVVSAIFSVLALLVTSVIVAIPTAPSFSMTPSVSVQSLTSFTATLAPSLANCRAYSCPRPRAAPVIITVLFVKSM